MTVNVMRQDDLDELLIEACDLGLYYNTIMNFIKHKQAEGLSVFVLGCFDDLLERIDSSAFNKFSKLELVEKNSRILKVRCDNEGLFSSLYVYDRNRDDDYMSKSREIISNLGEYPYLSELVEFCLSYNERGKYGIDIEEFLTCVMDFLDEVLMRLLYINGIVSDKSMHFISVALTGELVSKLAGEVWS